MLPNPHPLQEMAQFWLATLNGNSNITATKCPQDYIVGLYSTFAARFDTLLVESLQYHTPTELRKLVDSVLQQQSTCSIQRCIDLGCGTGLSGEAFRGLIRGHLLGVDLSPEMIAKAKMRQFYQELVVGDCLSVLKGQGDDVDLIIACDVSVYLGDLEPVFHKAQTSLSEEGIFAFSTELLTTSATNSKEEYILQACARFAHAKAYIERLAIQFNFRMVGYKASTIRKTQGKNVQGQLVALRRKI